MTDTPLFLRLKANEEAFRLRNNRPPMTAAHVERIRIRADRIESRADDVAVAFDQALEDQEEYNRELSRQIS